MIIPWENMQFFLLMAEIMADYWQKLCLKIGKSAPPQFSAINRKV